MSSQPASLPSLGFAAVVRHLRDLVPVLRTPHLTHPIINQRSHIHAPMRIPVGLRGIGRVGLLSLLSCHLGATGERQYDEERGEPSLQVHWY